MAASFCFRIFLCTFAALSMLAEASLAQQSDRKIALVIGEGKYQYVPRLDNTSNDARLIAKTLQTLGFTLVGSAALIDLDEPSLKKVIRSFGDALSNADVALFYYAGHGLQMQGANYLVPVDANPTKPSDADFMLVDADLVLRQMDDSAAKLKLMILDACRNNPFGGRGLRTADGGLAQMQAPVGTLIAYATQPGAVAIDGPPGGDSPYTVALAKGMQQPGIGFRDMFNDVGLSVDAMTKHTQLPWYSSSPIQGNFYFAGPAVAPYPPAPASTNAAVATLPSTERESIESRFPIGGQVRLAQPSGATTDRFLGEWYGAFGAYRGYSLEVLFAIQRVENDKVTAIYTYGAGGYGSGFPGTQRRIGQVRGDRIVFNEPGYAALDIGLQSNGSLEIKWTSSDGRAGNTAVLHRISN